MNLNCLYSQRSMFNSSRVPRDHKKLKSKHMKKVLVNEKVSPDALNILKKAAEVVYIPSGDHGEIIKMLKDISGIMLDTTIKFTGELMDSAPNLKVISRTGTGVDNVDVEAATKRGILVLHTPDANTWSSLIQKHGRESSRLQEDITFLLTLMAKPSE
jgi:hypothetical protein